jgi:Fe-S cluster assembly protein SufD
MNGEQILVTENADKNTEVLTQWTGISTDTPAGPAWLYPLRREAGSRFVQIGFPDRHNEEWRFTPITPLIETPFVAAAHDAPADDRGISEFLFPDLEGYQIVFVNGVFQPGLSTIGTESGLHISNLAHDINAEAALIEPHLGRYAAFDSQPFVALNTAAISDGAFIHVARNTNVELPIHLLYFSTSGETPTASHPRTLIIAEESSSVTIVESYAGETNAIYLTNAVTEIVVGANANIDHYKLQRESGNAFHVATLQVQHDRDSVFSTHAINLGSRIARNDSNAVLAASGIECTLNGLYMGRGNQLIDNHTYIDHAMPHCASHEVYKGILDGKARGVFNGKILVRQDAQKTDAKQTNKTLLLSDDAQINTKPQLEIYADDVKCTHGATVGQLSAEALFYLRARGIPLAEARSLLTYAFAADIVGRIKVEPVRHQLDLALLRERALEGIGS